VDRRGRSTKGKGGCWAARHLFIDEVPSIDGQSFCARSKKVTASQHDGFVEGVEKIWSNLTLQNAERLLQAYTAGGLEECGIAWS
jgi:hypothetical protein